MDRRFAAAAAAAAALSLRLVPQIAIAIGALTSMTGCPDSVLTLPLMCAAAVPLLWRC